MSIAFLIWNWCALKKKTNPAQYEERKRPLNEHCMWLIIYPRPPSVVCPLHSHHHVSLLLTPHSPAFNSPSFLFPLSINTFLPPPPISSVRPVHYVHSTCGAHFISLHLRQSEWPPLPPVSDECISKLYMHTCTRWLLSASSGGSIHSWF